MWKVLCALLAAAVVGTGGVMLHGPREASAHEKVVVVRAGEGEDGYAVNMYLPVSLTVEAGTTVRWEFPWFEPHTITFGTPQTGAAPSAPSGSTYSGSGFLSSDLTFGPGKSYDVVFDTPGTYSFYCVIHVNQKGTITVVEPGDHADSQEALDERANEEYLDAVTELKDIARVWATTETVDIPLPDGTTEHLVNIAGDTERGDVQQFFPPLITVTEGDTMRWRSLTITGHTVTFGPPPSGPAILGNPEVDIVSKPAGSYEGTGYWNSGILGTDWPSGVEFAMTFGRPGAYVYYCIPHETQGMAGVVNVVARGASETPTPIAPVTGTGRVEGGGDLMAMLVLAVALVAVGAGVLGWRVVRIR